MAHADTQQQRMRTVADGAVRIQLVLLVPATLALVGAAAARGGAWLVLLGPAAVLLALHARLVAAVGIRSWAGAAGNAALLAAGAATVVLVVGPVLGLYRTVTVLSGSMRPTFGPGDVIVVSPEPAADLQVGQVLSFRSPIGSHQVETHRVIGVVRRGGRPIVTTKGDANAGADPWQAELHGSTLWRYRFRLPLLGYPILLLRTEWAHRISVLLLPTLLALWALARLWLPPRPGKVQPGA